MNTLYTSLPTSPLPALAGDDVRARLKDNNFDVLRLLFASMVVLFHIALLSQVPVLYWMEKFISSTFAVQAFFFISGFLVFMSCERSSTLKSYFSKRLWRIVPAYVVVVVSAAVLLAPASSLPLRDYFLDPGWRNYLFYNLLLSNFSAPTLPGVFSGNHETAVNGSLWTIKIEVAFYFAVPVIVWLIRRFGCWLVLSTIFVLSIGWKVGFHLAAEHSGLDLYNRLAKQLPGQLAFFMGGGWAFYRTQHGKRPPTVWMMLLSVVTYAMTDGLLYQLLAPIAVTVIVYWLAMAAPRVWNPGQFGDFSYGLYLYHFPIVQLFISKGYFEQHVFGAIAVLLLLVAIISIASWFLLERKFLQHRRHVL